MKRLLSLMLAAAMVLSMGAMTVSAADINYPVAFVWDTGFLKDEDGVLQIGDGDGVDEVPYGSTVYFPLINENYTKHNDLVALENALEAAKKTRDDAKTALDNAKATLQTAVDTARAAVDTAEADVATAQDAVDDADAKYKEALNKYNAAKNASEIKAALKSIVDNEVASYDAKVAEKAPIETSISDINAQITTWEGNKTQLNGYKDTLNANLTNYYATEGDKTAAESMMTWLNNLNNTFTSKVTINGLETYADVTAATTGITTVIDELINKCNLRLGAADTTLTSAPGDPTLDFYQWRNYYNAEKATVESEISTLAGKIKDAITKVNNDYETSYDVNTTSASTISGWANDVDTSADVNALKTASDNAKTTLDTANATLTEKNTALTNANSALTIAQNNLTNDSNVQAKQTAYDNAVIAYNKAEKDLNDAKVAAGNGAFVFVTESAAVSNAKVKADWDYGSKYVDSIELDKVKAYSTEFGMNGKQTSIYCIAVTLEESTSTDEAEVEGEIAISKSGSNGYSLADTAADISLTICAPSAEPDAEITAKPQLFVEDYSFDAEEDHIFYFEEDDSSWFEVNTKTQKDIVLAFDTEWDDDLADEIYEKNPNADLDFYNGNYAKFSKTGTLWLGYPEDDADDAYVYAVSTSGKLSLVNADYDEYEEAFEIRTNTLGRYVISTEKLKLSSSSSSSGSGAGTGTGTVTSSRSSTTTVASSSKPASSTPASSSKPASSTPAASSSQVSSQESSKESKPSSEPLSIKEPSSEEENQHVSGTTEPDDEDVPTKKGGVSWIVWLLILAGLVAVVVAVGVIFYTKKNSGRRML